VTTARRLPFPISLTSEGIQLREWTSDDLDDLGLKEAELGYLVGAPFRRRGLAAGALSLLSGYAHNTLNLRRLLLRIDPANTASIAVARRCGYRLTGEPPILQEGPHGPSSLDTWELVETKSSARQDRLRNVAPRRYGRRP